MTPPRLSALFAAFGLCALASGAQAELYKWVDEKGVVNYSDAPPANARAATTLDATRSSLSVVPGLGKDELARLETRAETARADRLERENAELRARLATPPPTAPAPRAEEPVTVVPVYVPQAVRRPPADRRPPPVRVRPVDKTVPPPAAMRLDR